MGKEAVEKVLEGTTRKFPDRTFWAAVVLLAAIAMSSFHLYTAGTGVMMAMKQRGFHLTFVLVLIFLLYPATSRSPRHHPSFLDIILVLLSIVSIGHVALFIDDFYLRGAIPTTRELVLGITAIPLVLEAARRTIGPQLSIIGLIFIAYCFWGDHIPGLLSHSGFGWKRIVEQMYLTDQGIFSIALGVSATFIFLFVFLGVLLGRTGMANFINDIAMSLAGHAAGGPAKVAVVASSIMGTISGAAAANVATTGAFTIPLMKRIGYKPPFAAAVEAAASSGGQIMPPIMGAAAFIMAEFLAIPYRTIMIAGIFPALLYYIAVWAMLHLEARKLNLSGLPREELPVLWNVVKTRGHLGLPLVAVVYFLVIGYTPLTAAFYGIVCAFLVSFLRPETRLGLRGWIEVLKQGAINSLTVAIACAVVGFIIGTNGLTALGPTLAHAVIELARGILFFALLLTAIVCVILGMGLPTSACYITAAVIMAPTLVRLGVDPLPAHFFVFYFATLSTVTPPVALASYTGAAIAGSNPNITGITAFRLALAGFIIPFTFIYHPVLLLEVPEVMPIVLGVVTAVIGMLALASSLQRFLYGRISIPESLILFAAALMLVMPGIASDAPGLAIFVVMVLIRLLLARRRQEFSGINGEKTGM